MPAVGVDPSGLATGMRLARGLHLARATVMADPEEPGPVPVPGGHHDRQDLLLLLLLLLALFKPGFGAAAHRQESLDKPAWHDADHQSSRRRLPRHLRQHLANSGGIR